MKIIKKQLIIIISVVLCLSMALTGLYASASSPGNGRMTVRVAHGTQPLSGMTVNIYRVATVSVGAQVVYDPTGDFIGAASSWDGVLRDLTTSDLIKLVESYEKHARDGSVTPYMTGVTGEQGIVVFYGLETGLYLVIQGENSTRYTYSGALMPIIMESDDVVVNGKAEWWPPSPPPTPPTPPPEPPPTTPPPRIPPSEVIVEPEVPLVEPPATPPDEPDFPLPEPPIPLVPMPPSNLPQTGITNWDLVIIILLALGVALVTIGMVQLRRTAKKEQPPSEKQPVTE